MSLTRRSILASIAGLTTAATSGMSAKQVFGAGLPVPDTDKLMENHVCSVGYESTEEGRADHLHRRKLDFIADKLHEQQYRWQRQERMPVHIAGKKSWSEQYKHHVWVKEEQAFRDFMRALDHDKTFAQQIFDLMGLREETLPSPGRLGAESSVF